MNNPYAAKLTFHLQCFIHAAHWTQGYSYPTLARAFGIAVQTVNKICNPKRGYYRAVHAQANLIGREQMWKAYTLPELETRLREAQNARDSEAPVFAPILAQAIDTGTGSYWLTGVDGDKLEVNIQPYDKIKDEIGYEVKPEHQNGYWAHYGANTWIVPLSRPFESIAEALRFFAEYPPSKYGY